MWMPRVSVLLGGVLFRGPRDLLELWQESLDDVERHLLTKAEARF